MEGTEEQHIHAQLQLLLSRKTQELKQVQAAFDEFTESSHDLEQELEQELARAEARNTHLSKRVQTHEHELQLTRDRLSQLSNETHQLHEHVSTLTNTIKELEHAKQELEQAQDDSETRIRILVATEDELRHRLEREMEDKVFIANEKEELQRQLQLSNERYRMEIKDLQLELELVHKRLQDNNRTDFDTRYNKRPFTNPDTNVHSSLDDQALGLQQSAVNGASIGICEKPNDREGKDFAADSALNLDFTDTRNLEMENFTQNVSEKSQELSERDTKIKSLKALEIRLQKRLQTLESSRNDILGRYSESKRDLDRIRMVSEDLEMRLQQSWRKEMDAAMKSTAAESKVWEMETRLASIRNDLDQERKSTKERENRLLQRYDIAKQKEFASTDPMRQNDCVVNINCYPEEQMKGQKTHQEGKDLLSICSPMPQTILTPRCSLENTPKSLSQASTSAENDDSTTESGSTPEIKEQTNLTPTPSKSETLQLPIQSLTTDYTLNQLEAMYIEERSRNAFLLSRLQNVYGNIQVLCRIRPIIAEERSKHWGSNVAVKSLNYSDIAAIDFKPQRIPSEFTDPENAIQNSSWKMFTFDRVLGPSDTQLDVFHEVEPLAQSVMEGYKTCVFAYGQTGSGKTYTMQGLPENPGLNYRIIDHIFQAIAHRHCHTSSQISLAHTAPAKFTVRIGTLEIYNESLRDLAVTSENERKPLQIRQDGDTNEIHVPGLTMRVVSNVRDTLDILEHAQQSRCVARTDLNAHSSRSHLIIILEVLSIPLDTDADAVCINESFKTCGKLYLVDLAGCERVKKSQVSGEALKEAAHINKSLSALADVLEALDKKASHVPYRNSKLTYLLQDVLQASCKTIMILNVSPVLETAHETYRSLQLAARVRNIVVGRNVIALNKKDSLTAKQHFTEMQTLRQQLNSTTRKLTQLQQKLGASKREHKKDTEKQLLALQQRLRSSESQCTKLNLELKALAHLNKQLKEKGDTSDWRDGNRAVRSRRRDDVFCAGNPIGERINSSQYSLHKPIKKISRIPAIRNPSTATGLLHDSASRKWK